MSDFISLFSQNIYYIGMFFGILYLLIVFWVAKDIAQRSTSIMMQGFSIVIAIAMPLIGIIIYLLIRPELLIHKEIREFLASRN